MVTLEYLAKAVRGSKKEREKAIRGLAGDKHLQSKVRGMVLTKGGNGEDAMTVFSDTIVAFAKRLMKDHGLGLTASLDAYILGIAKYKWYDLLNSRSTKLSMTDMENITDPSIEAEQYTLLRNSEKWAMLEKVLSVMATRCKQVLMLWSAGHSMKEIALELNYKSDGMARKKKSECMKELLIYLGKHPQIKEQLR